MDKWVLVLAVGCLFFGCLGFYFFLNYIFPESKEGHIKPMDSGMENGGTFQVEKPKVRKQNDHR